MPATWILSLYKAEYTIQIEGQHGMFATVHGSVRNVFVSFLPSRRRCCSGLGQWGAHAVYLCDIVQAVIYMDGNDAVTTKRCVLLLQRAFKVRRPMFFLNRKNVKITPPHPPTRCS